MLRGAPDVVKPATREADHESLGCPPTKMDVLEVRFHLQDPIPGRVSSAAEANADAPVDTDASGSEATALSTTAHT